jgi:hypothetical protein
MAANNVCFLTDFNTSWRLLTLNNIMFSCSDKKYGQLPSFLTGAYTPEKETLFARGLPLGKANDQYSCSGLNFRLH